jgi:hypothetical protein
MRTLFPSTPLFRSLTLVVILIVSRGQVLEFGKDLNKRP